MQISSRFTIALHMFACMEMFGKDYKITSDFLAGSIQVNPVVIRKLLSQLKEAGLITVTRGPGGARPTRSLNEITFFDVYKATDLVENGNLFHFHEHPNPDCPVGRNIHASLDGKLDNIQQALEMEMKRYTIQDVADDIKGFLAGTGAADHSS